MQQPIVFDLDDLCDRYDPYEILVAAKKRLPGLRVTMFAIPGQCSEWLLGRYKALDWVELGVHGYHHSTMECAVWGEQETKDKVGEVEDLGYFAKVFRSPGWTGNEVAYETLGDLGYVVAAHVEHLQDLSLFSGLVYVYNDPATETKAIHGHTWETCGNGPSWWTKELEALPADTEFLFVSQAATKREVAA